MADAVSSPDADPVERILAESPIGMTAAARLFGTFKAGKPVHPSTVTRWASEGVQLAGGRRLRLEAVRISGRLVTSRAAVVRFLKAQQESPPPCDNPPLRSPAARHRASEAAGSELDALGIR